MRVARAACALLGLGACARSHPSTAPEPARQPAAQPTGQPTPAVIVRGANVFVREESFVTAHGDSALHAFVADVPPYERGGECQLVRSAGSGATTVIAFFPTHAASRMNVSMSFDSVGHLVTYGETRGVPPPVKLPPGTPPARLDSAFTAGRNAVRSTVVSLNYALDRALVLNRGGGKPTAAVTGTVRDVEHLASLGDPAARMERVRTLCGV